MPRKATRNAQGSGTIRQRKDGLWEARFTVGRDPGTGKQIQKSVYGKTQAEVAQKMRRATHELDEGIYMEPSKLTLAAWMEIWLKEYSGSIKPTTLEQYRYQERVHIRPALGAVKLTALTPSMVQKLYNDSFAMAFLRSLSAICTACFISVCIRLLNFNIFAPTLATPAICRAWSIRKFAPLKATPSAPFWKPSRVTLTNPYSL